jgi:hypothetical protein
MIHVEGDVEDEHGHIATQDLELWMRNPLDCVKELMVNPAFKDHLVYEPIRVWQDTARDSRLYGEMWTGDWWWDTLVCELVSGCFAVLILYSGKGSHGSGGHQLCPRTDYPGFGRNPADEFHG